MAISTGTNPLGPLDQVIAGYENPAAWSRSPRTATAAQRADHLAAYVDLTVSEPEAIQSLHELVAELYDTPDLGKALRRVLAGATALMGTEAGNIQLLDPADNSLVLVTQRGFQAEFVEHFAVVNDNLSVCGRAAANCAQAVVVDVQDDPAFVPHRDVFQGAGVRAVQSTPLLDHTGRMIGMISTHEPDAGQPAERDLRLMALYSQLAGEVIAQHLSRIAPRPADPPRLRPRVPAPPRVPARSRPEQPMVQLLVTAINQIFAAGLSFAAAQSLVTNGNATVYLQAGIDSLDNTIRTIHLAAHELAHAHDNCSPRHRR